MHKLVLRIFPLLLLISFIAGAAEIPPKPETYRLVNDYAGILAPGDAAALENKLRAYEDSTSTQIAIVTIKSLEGDDIFDYAQKLATSWGIGQKGRNNGILILVAKDDRKMNIHTGYGMEGTITDAQSKRIIDNIMRPKFKEGDFAGGLNEAVARIISLASGEYKAEPKTEGKAKTSALKAVIGFIMLVIILAIMGNNRNNKIRRYSKTNGVDFLTAAMLLGMAGRGGGFGSGRGGFGGGGGGFGGGGFGGGGFGGGGASGSW